MTGFSIATVSNAMNDSPVVAARTKDLIRSAAERISYAANPRAASLRTGRTGLVAALLPVDVSAGNEWNGVGHAEVLSGVSQAIQGTPYQLSIFVVRDAAEGRMAAERIVTQRLADGIFFSGILTEDPRIDYLLRADFPFVALGRGLRPSGYAHVDIDSGWVAREATRRLIAGGHRRIALLNPEPRFAYAQERIAGYRAALAEAGLPLAGDLIAEGDLTARFGRQSVLHLRGLEDPPTGFVCANEAATLGLLAGLNSLGLSPDGAVSVIAYDDLNVSAYFSPPVTTYFQPVEELGRTLGAFLLRRMAGEPPEHLIKVFRPSLIPRQPDRLARREMDDVPIQQRRQT
ncbi:LacI family DNA-binding transcriptional regulator [Albidovulum sp.]|uniref:LacI family DNA-binding transcriptional regulator n=1 Tax=Albidovulum sp. TaxID=1872424 RepID=UPI003529CCB5